MAIGDRLKTDKRDSLKLATLLSMGRLRGIHVLTKEREAFRALMRARETFVIHRRRFACQIKSMLFRHEPIPFDDERFVSEKWIKSLSSLPMTDDVLSTTAPKWNGSATSAAAAA